jgi:adenylate cyclase
MPFFSIDKYTSNARKVYYRHPLISKVAGQVYFWIIAYLVMAGILHFYSLFIDSIYEESILYVPGPAFLGSFIVAVVYGTTLGLADHYVFRNWNRKHPLVLLIIIKGAFYLFTMTILFTIMRYAFWENVLFKEFFGGIGAYMFKDNWHFMYYVFSIYTLSMGLVISFINQMNKRFGPGVLLPFIMGKYNNPVKEKRIFMFLDLDNSTQIAEKLGHLKYSKLIRDCFWEINKATMPFDAEIYQYVGDEMVLTWIDSGNLDYLKCIDFYFATKKRLMKKKDYFERKYNLLPHFKAGVNIG